MVQSLFSRLKRFAKPDRPTVEAPDLSRLKGTGRPTTARETKSEFETIDMSAWMRRDMETLASAWLALQEGVTEERKKALGRAIHNLHGASGAYGGGTLTRLTASLQRLSKLPQALWKEAALINLHIQAIRAYSFGQGEGQDALSDRVCDALEIGVTKIAKRPAA